MNKLKVIAFQIITPCTLGIMSAGIGQRLVDLFFYNVFVGTFVSVISSILIMRVFGSRLGLEKYARHYLLTISALLCFSFLSTIPLTIDRSYSVWLLKQVTESQSIGSRVWKAQLIEESTLFFSSQNGQLDRRIAEQVRIGNFKISNSEEVVITAKGKLIARINSVIGVIFGLDSNYSRLRSP